MTVVGVLSLVSDVLFIGWSALVVIILLVTTIGKLFGARTIFDDEDPDEDDVYLERLDKLQESVDCLAARRLDELASAAAEKASELTSNERIVYIKCTLLKLHRSLIDIKELKEVELESLGNAAFNAACTSNDYEFLRNTVSSLSDALDAVIDTYDSLEEIPLAEAAL